MGHDYHRVRQDPVPSNYGNGSVSSGQNLCLPSLLKTFHLQAEDDFGLFGALSPSCRLRQHTNASPTTGNFCPCRVNHRAPCRLYTAHPILCARRLFELAISLDALRLKNTIQLYGIIFFSAAMTAYAALMGGEVRFCPVLPLGPKRLTESGAHLDSQRHHFGQSERVYGRPSASRL